MADQEQQQDSTREVQETAVPPTPPQQPQAPAPQQPAAQSQPQPQPQRRQQQQRRQQGRREGRHQERQHGNQQGGQQHDGAPEISVVIPLFNEEQSLRELYDKLRSALQKSGRYEIVFIDDGSTDGSMRVLHDLRHRDRRVKIVRFRRNYGKSAALSVGFHHARGEYVITMDADLQDDPNEIASLVNELKKGFDLVSGWKKRRRDPITKTIPSKFFNFVTSVLTGIKIHDFNCGLKGYKREVVKEVKVYGELHRYIPVLAAWQGFKIGEIPVQHHPRRYGKTKFGFGRFWKGFLDLLTVLFTTRFFRSPLHLFGFIGMVFSLAGFIIDGYLVYLKFAEGMSLGNRPLFVGGILLIIVGVQFVSVGLLGEMITKSRTPSEEDYSIREVWK